MFLGSTLSSSSERKTTSPRGVNSRSKESSKHEIKEEHKRKISDKLPIIYKNEEGSYLTRDIILRYLLEIPVIITEPYNIDEIVEDSINSGKPLHLTAMEFQRDILEFNYQVERNYGCEYMSKIPNEFANDLELNIAARDFMMAAMKSFTKAIDVRKEKYIGVKLKTSGGMTRDTILEFLEACNATMSLPETKELLSDIVRVEKKSPAERCVQIQREILEKLGFNKDYGVSCLNNIARDFPNDREIEVKMQHFALRAQFGCQEAMMTDEAREQFYKQCPIFMQNIPHLYILQSQTHAEKEHQKMMEYGLNPQDKEGSLKIAKLIQSSEGQNLLLDFFTRIHSAKESAEIEIASWDTERKSVFVSSFGEFLEINSIFRFSNIVPNSDTSSNETNAAENLNSDDVFERFTRFLNLTNDEMESFLKVQLILADDVRSNGGKLMTELVKGKTNGNIQSSTVLQSLTLFKQIATISSRSNQSSHDHSHAHSSHGPNCSHHSHHDRSIPDVSSGKAETMER